MKNSIDLYNHYQPLREFPDSYLPIDRYKKSYFELHGRLFIYCYAPANIIYSCSCYNNIKNADDVGDFLRDRNIQLKLGCNFLNHVEDLEVFHQDFLKYFVVDNPIFYTSHDYDPEDHMCNSENSDSSSDASDDNDYWNMEIELITRSETYLE